MGQLLDGGHADGMVQALTVGGFQLVLGDIVRVGHSHAGDKDVGGIGQIRTHGAGAVLKLKMLHGNAPFLCEGVGKANHLPR